MWKPFRRKKKVEEPKSKVPFENFKRKKILKQTPIIKPNVDRKFPKIKIPGLRQSKRILATLLVFVSIFFALGSLATVDTFIFSLVFFLMAFLQIDYVWKTRKKAIIE